MSWLFFVGMCLVFLYDLYRVYRGQRSISVIVWESELAHPTLILGVAVAGIYGTYLTWSEPPIAASILLITGHLCTSEGAYAVLTSADRWKATYTRNRILAWLEPD